MNEDDRVTRFLLVEADASRLLDELSAQKQEAESYRTAAKGLDDARQQLGEAIKVQSQVAEQAKAVVKAIGSVGTPQILSRLDELELKLDQIVSYRRRGDGSPQRVGAR